MTCHKVVLDKSPGVHSVGIGETLRRSLTKLVIRASGDQEKVACGNIQMCAGLKARVEGAYYVVRQRQRERAVRGRIEYNASTETHDEEAEAKIWDILRMTTGAMKEEAMAKPRFGAGNRSVGRRRARGVGDPNGTGRYRVHDTVSRSDQDNAC